MPTKSDIEAIDSAHVDKIISSLPKIDNLDIWTMLPNAPEDALDLMHKCMAINPSKRLDV